MVIYPDTSALIKLYVQEKDRALVEEALGTADGVVIAVVAYSEARAVLARRLREGDFTRQEYQDMVSALDKDWITFDRLHISDLVAYHAGHLAELHALRGFDAVHLASALYLAERFDDLQFLAFDGRLLSAASAAGLTVYPTPS